MNNFLTFLIQVIMVFTFIACKGGYRDRKLTDDERLFRVFEKEFHADEFILVKSSKRGEILSEENAHMSVVYNEETGEYMALDLTEYPVREWVGCWYCFDGTGDEEPLNLTGPERRELSRRISDSLYRNLEKIDLGGGTYGFRDNVSGIVFEKTEGTPKDLAKISALNEKRNLSKLTKKLRDDYGLTHARALTLSKLSLQWNKAGGKSLSKEIQSQYLEEAFGFSYNELIEGISHNSLDALIEKSAMHNEITPEHALKIIQKYEY